jgi:hypothetical protein
MKIFLAQHGKHLQTATFPGIRMRDATKPVTVTSITKDAMTGLPGRTLECARSQTCNRVALGDDSPFPHPVFFVEWSRSRAYLVDKVSKDGWPVSCVRYYHHDNGDAKYDDLPIAQFVAEGRAEGDVTLYPPTQSTRHEGEQKPPQGGSHHASGSAGKCRGALGRALRTLARY